MGLINNILGRFFYSSNTPKETPKQAEVKKSIFEDYWNMPLGIPTQSDINSYEGVYTAPSQFILPPAIKDMCYASDVYRTIMNALKQETFRQGFEILQQYTCKCEECGATYDYEDDKCDFCGGSCFTPSIIVKEKLEQVIRKANPMQNLSEVFETLEDDLNIFDNCFMVINKTYNITDRKIISAEINGVYRGDPINMRKLVDAHGRLGYLGNKKAYTCPFHRNKVYFTNTPCAECGRVVYPAHYAQVSAVVYGNESLIYFIEGEVFHKTKFTSTMHYGLPPVYSLYRKINTLIAEDDYTMSSFTQQKPPRGILAVKTSSIESFIKQWQRMLAETIKFPHQIFPLGIESKENIKGNAIEFIDFMRSFQELQFVEHRDEFRKAIGAFFGVQPLFMGDTSASGGLNNERLQVVVTNRAIERSQSIHNALLQELSFQLGSAGWKIQLIPSEERDEMNELMIENQKLQNALAYKQLGYKAELSPEGEFNYVYDESTKLQNDFSNIGFGGGLGQNLLGLNSVKPQQMGSSGEPFNAKSTSKTIKKKMKLTRKKLKEHSPKK